MNVISRGIRNALRSPVRSGAIVLMLAISIGLVLAMLVARSSVNAKIDQVKATTATKITINPAGIQGGMGGGNLLTADQVKAITSTSHVTNVVSALADQLGSNDTNLTPSFTLGSFGLRQQRFENAEGGSTPNGESNQARKMPAPRTNVTGTTDPTTIVTNDKLTSGAMINGTSSDDVALVGKTLADKNNLSLGSTFTAYGTTITVKGIFSSGNIFEDNGIVMPLITVQTLTKQVGNVSSIVATADSSDNVAGIVTSLKSSLGTAADITSQLEEAQNSLAPLENIASLALTGVIGAAIAGAIIILLSMIMIVRERRREIGVIKAIGGTNAKVIVQFMAEALTLTIIGGIIGLGIGVVASGPMTQSLVSNNTNAQTTGIVSPAVSIDGATHGSESRMFVGNLKQVSSQLATNFKTINSTLTPQIFASSIGVIFLIAIIGSAIPAWSIARVRPAEVLRTE